MEDKKRKKFGLSLKNAKRLALTDSKVNDQRSNKTFSSMTLKKVAKEQQKNVLVVDDGQASCDLQECGLKGKQKPPEKTLGEQKLVRLDNEQERERILWRNLFSGSSTTNWETMEDLPVSAALSSTGGMKNEAESSIKINENSSMENKNVSNFSGSLTQASLKMDAFDVDLDYEDLPKPCIGCYAMKHHPLVWSQDDYGDDKDDANDDDNDKTMEDDIIYDASTAQDDCALDIKNSNIKRINYNSQKNLSSTTSSVKNFVALKSSETTEKPGTLFGQCMEHKKKSYLQTNGNRNTTVKNNKGSFSESPARKLKTIDQTTTTVSSSSVPKQESRNRQAFGKSFDFKKPQGFINKAFKIKSKTPGSNVGDSGAKRNFAAAKKEILQSCPICQLQFSQVVSKEEIDQHISNCIRDGEIFIDDEYDYLL